MSSADATVDERGQDVSRNVDPGTFQLGQAPGGHEVGGQMGQDPRRTLSRQTAKSAGGTGPRGLESASVRSSAHQSRSRAMIQLFRITRVFRAL